MRKRAQLKGKPIVEEPKHVVHRMQQKKDIKTKVFKKNSWIGISLIGIFLLVLFFNTYFNLTSEVSINPEGEGFSKYYLSGPDPYYNMRLVEETYKTGSYPYYSESDPLLRYPIGAKGGRAPLFNMMALGFSRFLTPFMDEIDAIGYSMQFIPALFGALLIFPVFFIGKDLFNKKSGLMGAMFIAIIPIHLGSGHGSAYALFDHDSFNLLLFFLTFMFLIKSIKEKDTTKSVLYAIIGGVALAGLTMTWVEAEYLYVIIAIYAVVQMFIDIFTNKIELQVVRTISVILFSGYLISLPVISGSIGIFAFTIPLFLVIAITAFGAVYYFFGKKKIPWTLSIPTIFSVGLAALIFLYFIDNLRKSFPFLNPLKKLSDVIFGTGIYGKKVSITIAEANTYEISQTVMSFGPSLYWIAWGGFIYLLYRYYKNKQRRDYLFIVVLFIVNIWLASIAGRFLNDMVPIIAILAGWIVWLFTDWLDYKQMLRNIKSAGGGIHGIRRGVKFLHVFGILFIAFLVVLPSTFIAFDAAVPNAFTKNRTSILKIDMFGEDHQGAFGLGVGKERYWVDAFEWLNEQDFEIEDPTMRPAFISWWDYGFYEVAVGDHPTVADNFQDGIPTAANFHTSTSEREAVAIFIIRLLEGNRFYNNNKISKNVEEILIDFVGTNNTKMIKSWLSNPTSSPSYWDPIDEEYDIETSKEYRVGQQYPENAVYHDIADILLNKALFDPEINETVGLSDEELTWLYHNLQEETGFSIRYYGVEGYDRQIFNIFGFLADKSLLLINGIEDDFIELVYKGYKVDSQGEIVERDKSWPAREIMDMDPEERRFIVITNTQQIYKDPYFETMFYKTYIGPAKGESGNKEEFDYQIPCLNMKHFYAEYISDLSEFPYYGTGKGAVVIAKYYEGAYINGTVSFLGKPVDAEVSIMKNLTYYEDYSIPIDHDTGNTNINEDNASGNFNLIAGAGNVTLQVRTNLGEAAFILKNLTFEGSIGSELEPISDDDAMRRNDSNYERILNITIDPANLEGHVFDDIDNDGLFNESIDEPLDDTTVMLMRVIEIFEDENRVEFDEANAEVVDTNEAGQYNMSDLLPGIYRLIVMKDDYNLHLADVTIYHEVINNTYDVPNAKLSSLEGVVFIDADGNEEYDFGEELLEDVVVELLHGDNLVNTYKTDKSGYYHFDSLIPGNIGGLELNEYTIKAVKAPEYEAELIVYPVENETTISNISIGLSPVYVNGIVTYNGKPIEEVDINFISDKSVIDNTATDNETIAKNDGTYEINLSPGIYNVTLEKKDKGILIYALTDQKLNLSKGQGTDTVNFKLDKKSVTLTGKTTKYEGGILTNVSIDFTPDVTFINAAQVSTFSDENGTYSVEISPGNYSVKAIKEEFFENQQNLSYEFTGTIIIVEAEITSGKTFDIILVKTESE